MHGIVFVEVGSGLDNWGGFTGQTNTNPMYIPDSLRYCCSGNDDCAGQTHSPP